MTDHQISLSSFLTAISQFPNQGLSLCQLQWKHGILTTGPPPKSQDPQISAWQNSEIKLVLLEFQVYRKRFLIWGSGARVQLTFLPDCGMPWQGLGRAGFSRGLSPWLADGAPLEACSRDGRSAYVWPHVSLSEGHKSLF